MSSGNRKVEPLTEDEFALARDVLAEYSQAALSNSRRRWRFARAGNTEEARECDAERASINWRCFTALVELPASGKTHAFEEAFLASSFPEVVSDRGRLSDQFDDALRATDLSDDQRQSIVEMRHRYQVAYRILMLEMAELASKAVWWWIDDEGRLWPGGSPESEAELRRLRSLRALLNGSNKRGLRRVIGR